MMDVRINLANQDIVELTEHRKCLLGHLLNVIETIDFYATKIVSFKAQIIIRKL